MVSNRLRTIAPTAPPTQPQINGFFSGSVTPYMAGSVMPNMPVRPAEKAIRLISRRLVFSTTPKQAAAWATTAQV